MADTFEILRPNKKLSQLIAQSWLDGNRLQIDKTFLVDNQILSQEEADIFKLEVDQGEGADLSQFSGQGSIDAVNFIIRLPYPQQPPTGITQEYLKAWVGSSPLEPLWVSAFGSPIIGIASAVPEPEPEPFSILRPSKKLSQLLAQSWLPGNEAIGEALVNNPKQFLIDNNIISTREEQYVKVEVDRNPSDPPYIGLITLVGQGDNFPDGGYKKYIPYPPRPSALTDAQLEQWVNSPVDVAPFNPFEISNLIPYTC